MLVHILSPYPIEALDNNFPEFIAEDLILALQYKDSRIIVDAEDSVVQSIMNEVGGSFHHYVLTIGKKTHVSSIY